jgi:hypothetical protein
MGDFHGFRGRGRSDAKHCKFLQLPAPYLTGKEVEKLMEAARAPPKSGHQPALRFIDGNCFFRYGRPRCCSTAMGRDLLDGYVSAEGSARDYDIADARMLRNVAAREEESQ